jgi:hypothetical protein
MTPAVLAWVERTAPGARVAGWQVRQMAGGAVSTLVEQVTLHLTDGRGPLDLVRKQAPALEIDGLRAAQAVRAHAPAVPELVAWGAGWLMTPLAPGAPLAWGDALPPGAVDALAILHARYHGGDGLPATIPRVTRAWWQGLCLDWVDPRLREHAGRHPPPTTVRARALVSRAAGHPAVPAVLDGLAPTLVHGDVHPGNVLVGAGQATLIDWGSCRVGPAALDLASLVTAGSPELARYALAWQRHAGQPLPEAAIEVGYRWAALQIPVQYLPWAAQHTPTRGVEAALDQIEQALSQLPA